MFAVGRLTTVETAVFYKRLTKSIQFQQLLSPQKKLSNNTNSSGLLFICNFKELRISKPILKGKLQWSNFPISTPAQSWSDGKGDSGAGQRDSWEPGHLPAHLQPTELISLLTPRSWGWGWNLRPYPELQLIFKRMLRPSNGERIFFSTNRAATTKQT